MSALALALAEGLDSTLLARRLGLVPDGWQASILGSEQQYQVLNCHRQAGKSTVAAVKSLHVAQNEPGSLVLLFSPGMRQSQLLYKRVRTYWRALGRAVPAEAENLTSLTLENGSEIICLPGDPETTRGYSAARLIVVDEAARVADEVMASLRPMLATSGGQLIAMSTPYGRRGWFYRAATGADGGWTVTTVPATDCPRISAEFLARERLNLGDLAFESEYLCRFVANSGGLFSGSDVDAMFTTALSTFDPQAPIGRGLRAVPTLDQVATA